MRALVGPIALAATLACGPSPNDSLGGSFYQESDGATPAPSPTAQPADAGTIAPPDASVVSTPDAAVDPYGTPPICTSGKTWTGGESGSMAPGESCMGCHKSFNLAGTVYPTAHEPKDCYGAPGPLTVVVTDKNAQVVTLTTNSSGNFYSGTQLAAPFHVKVVNGGSTRAMVGALTSGDCNSCHTQSGTSGAPGRIMAP